MERSKRAGPIGSPILVAAAWLLLAAVNAAAQQGEPLYDFAPPAAWVDVAPMDYRAPERSGSVESGRILLLDRQVDVAADGDEYYQHFAVEVANAADVDEYSQINVDVDPTYQTLAIHWMRVIREGSVIDQRPLARITALPQETELASRIYNGNYNVNVLLADVRVGDIVDFAYTVRSKEQLFPGHFATRLDTAWSTRVVRQRIRVTAPASRKLRFRLTDGAPVPEPRVVGDRLELVMEWTDVAPVAVEPSLPIWYYPWPSLEISDLESWRAASDLVAPLFAPRPAASTRVGAIVDEIRARGGSAREQALHALQYVQEEIRYTSIAIGRGSHEPADPDLVLERRFGDCKDKSLLLATILVGLGIDARPALVHSWRGRTLAEALPTPYAFDHAIVRAEIDGETYWLDATAPTRYSPLAVDDPADYELALVAGGADLEPIPKPAPHTRSRTVEMTFDLRNGVDATATLEMRTRYRGTLADAMRPLIARSTPEQREADYASYIARYYPGAQSLAPPEIVDDKSANELEIRERYRLDRLFSRDETGVPSFYLHADELYAYANATTSGLRRMPLGLEYPVQIRQRLVVHLPEEWYVEPDVLVIENPAFRYRSEARYADRTLEVTYDYQALDDHVPLDALAQYEADRSRFYDDLGYVLTYDDGSVGSGRFAVAPLPLAVLLLALGAGVWGALRLYRYDPTPPPAMTGDPCGIRGWLLLPALGCIVSPPLFGFVVVAYVTFVDAGVWYDVPNVVNDAYRSWAQVALLVLISGGVLVFIASIVVAVLFFRKRSSAPAAYIGLLWAGDAFMIGMLWWNVSAGLDTETTTAAAIGETIRELIFTTLWTLYMLMSRRVRGTFQRRLRPQAEIEAGMIPAQ
ncbi:MAG TPA: DUF3857 domain-containing protein [Gammaproteobacteria bacterium]